MSSRYVVQTRCQLCVLSCMVAAICDQLTAGGAARRSKQTVLKQQADPGNHYFPQASPLFILLGIVGESSEIFSGMAGFVPRYPSTAASWVSQRSAAWALLVQNDH